MLVKKTSFLLILTLVISNISFANTAVEEAAVKTVIEKYAAATEAKDVSALEDLFAKNAVIFRITLRGKEVIEYDQDAFTEQVKKGRLGGWKRDLEVQSVDVYDNTAVAKIKLTDKKLKQTEFLSFVKIDGVWKIVSCSLTREKA
ncbi:MAG: DUF3225 domain-containing protein [Ignavibacteria bacterium]|jgi:ketosteroid isomerase-like protein